MELSFKHVPAICFGSWQKQEILLKVHTKCELNVSEWKSEKDKVIICMP